MIRKLCFCGWEYDYQGDHEAFTKAFNEHFDSEQHRLAQHSPWRRMWWRVKHLRWSAAAQSRPNR